MLLASFARCLAESTHTAANGVRRVAAELVRDLRKALLTEHSDAARVAQTYVALHAVMRAWPARSSERLLLRAIVARFQIPTGRSATRKPSVGGR
jgi:hypothetical protein